MLRNCKPSAPANTRPHRASPEACQPSLPPPRSIHTLPRRPQQQRRVPITRQPPNNRMPLAPEADRSTLLTRPLCARLDQVSKLFGSFAALRKVSVDLEPGRCYVLIGENGAGKSTLLRILAGLLRPTHGTVKVFGDNDPHDV